MGKAKFCLQKANLVKTATKIQHWRFLAGWVARAMENGNNKNFCPVKRSGGGIPDHFVIC